MQQTAKKGSTTQKQTIQNKQQTNNKQTRQQTTTSNITIQINNKHNKNTIHKTSMQQQKNKIKTQCNKPNAYRQLTTKATNEHTNTTKETQCQTSTQKTTRKLILKTA